MGKNGFKTTFWLIFFAMMLCFTASTITAQENNKFGIHLAVPAHPDIEKAAELVNSNGGNWGYITLVIQEDDRDKNKWQGVMDKLRELHLIPLIRIATKPTGPSWKRAEKEEADQWVDFLNSLHWVVKDRHVILFNETNHGAEWGGTVDPVHYAEVTKIFAEKLKAKNSNFFIMMGGFDASAPSGYPKYADEAQYFKTVVDTITPQKYNELFSGLSSHSYPNPGFVGSPYGNGRGTVRTYEWELSLLRSWGVKELPVFITETGWEGNKLSRDTIARNFEITFQQIWLPDDRVKAVTPFILDYQGDPFLGFSWKLPGVDAYYPQFYVVQQISKSKGDPVQEEGGTLNYNLPNEYVMNSDYRFRVEIRNNGQAIWDQKDGYKLAIENAPVANYFFSDLKDIKPFQTAEVDLYFKTINESLKTDSQISLIKNDVKILSGQKWSFEVIPFPSLKFNVSLYPRFKHSADDFELLVFDEAEQLVFKRKNVKVDKRQGYIQEVRNIALGRKYRVVILKPYYLPRQTFVTFKKNDNMITFERMFPVDFNKDGKYSFFADTWALLQKPSLIKLLLP